MIRFNDHHAVLNSPDIHVGEKMFQSILVFIHQSSGLKAGAIRNDLDI